MAFNDGVRVAPVAYIGSVSVLVTFVLVLMLQVMYFRQHNEMVAAELAAEGPPPELADLTAKQQTALTQRGFVDRDRNIVSVGISRGMELVLTELTAGKSPAEVIGPKPFVAGADRLQEDSPPKEEAKPTAQETPEELEKPAAQTNVESKDEQTRNREKNDDGKS